MSQEEQIKQLKIMQAVFDTLTELLFITDETGNIIGSNSQAQKLCGYSSQKHFEHNLKMMEKLNALGETAGGVIHDFNNILSLILGNLDLLEKQAFPIVLTDLNMPEVSGWEVARFVREHHPDSAIIMLSGWEDSIQHINKEQKIIDHILQKPVSFSALSEIIKTLKQK